MPSSSSSSSESSESYLNTSSSSSYSSSSSSSFLDHKDKKTIPFVFEVNRDQAFLSIATNQGDIYVGTSPDGQVLSSSDGYFWSTLYVTDDISVKGLFFEGSTSTLYIGTGPNGYIYAYNVSDHSVNRYDIGVTIKGFANINNTLYAAQESPPSLLKLDTENDQWDVDYELAVGVLKKIMTYNSRIYLAIDKGNTGNSVISYDGTTAFLVGGDQGLRDV